MKPRIATLLTRAVHNALPIASGIICACLPLSKASAINYQGATGGLWSLNTNWVGSVVPGNGTTALLGVNAATSVNFDFNYTTPGLTLLTIDPQAVSTFTLNQTANGMFATTQLIGDTKFGAIYDQSGGTNTAGSLTLGNGTGSSSQVTNNFYNLSGTGTVSITNLSVGNAGSGVFNQSAGTVTVASLINIGQAATGVGQYTMTGGVLNASPGTIIVGNAGSGSFLQSAGVVNAAADTLFVAVGPNSKGNYTLNGPSALLTDNNLFIANGQNSSGTFVQSSGTHSNLNVLALAAGFNSTGSYLLSGGSLSSPFEQIGGVGTASFVHTGGVNTITGSGTLLIGGTGVSVYSLDNSAGASTLTAPTVTINTNGSFNQSGGTHNVLSALQVGAGGAGGAYNISAGTLNVGSTSSSAYIAAGYTGSSGVINQSGGIVNVLGANGSLNVAYNNNSTGSYNFSGGTITTATASVGASGNGAFTQSGGTLVVTGFGLQLGQFPAATGVFTLNNANGASVINSTSEIIGNSGTGTFNQSAGVHTVSSAMTIGFVGGSNGRYNMSGGTLSVTTLSVGAFGNATFNHTGGVVTITFGSVGGTLPGNSYALSGGTANLPAGTGNFVVNPTGAFSQSGGTLTGYLTNNGTFTYSGGTFNGTLENKASGTVNLGAFLITGENSVNYGNITVSSAGIGAATGKTFDNESVITLAGGALSGTGTFANNGLITGYGGIASGTFVNNGVITQGAGLLTLQNSDNTNNGIFTLSAGRQLQFVSGATLGNNATLQVNGAIVSGTGTLTNNASGVITGPGKISVTLVNNGSVLPNGGALNVVNPWTNAGVIQLGGPTSSLMGGTVANTGTVQGNGTIASSMDNTGTIEPTSGTLNFAGSLTNGSTGTIRTATGTKVLILASGTFSTNAGLLSLAGGTFDTGSHLLDNTGQIVGYGVLSTGGFTNSGSMTLTGGTSTVNGPVTNAAGKTLNVKYQPAIFSGDVTNNGTINVLSTTVTFAGNYIGNAYISDPALNIFQANVTITSGGIMIGEAGDAFNFAGGTINNYGSFINAGTLHSADNFNNYGTYTQSGAQTWYAGTTFTNHSGTATFLSDAGSLNAPTLAIIVNNGTVNFASSQHLASVTVNGGKAIVTSGATDASQFIINAAGTLQIGNAGATGTLGSGGTIANAGTLIFNRTGLLTVNGTISGAGAVNHIGSGTTTLAAYQGTGAISVTAGNLGMATTNGARQTSAVMIQPTSLAVSTGAALDIYNHDMMIPNSTYLTIHDAVLNGTGFGDPSGPQITSTTANLNPFLNTTLVPFSADGVLGDGSPGSAIGAQFQSYTDNVIVTAANTTIIKYAYYSDVDFSGNIDGGDLVAVLGNLGATTPGLADMGLSWISGDVDFSGLVDGGDVVQVLGALGTGSGGPNNGPLGGLEAPGLTPGIGATSQVPEPASLMLLGLGAGGMLLRRKRQR